jgi:aconitate hydratase
VKPLPDLAREYKEADVEWVAVGDENYGEGSSREHAAMEPRYMGGRAIIVRSFARIHEANLKKQGVLALTFADPADYEKFRVDDTVDVVGLAELAPGKPVTVVVHHADGSSDEIPTTHTMSEEHIEWFRAGSALNVLRQQS